MKTNEDEKVLSKLLACVLACCLILVMVPGASVFAQGELQEEPLEEDQQIDKGEAWQPETRIEDISFEGDLPLEELQSAKLADEDIPEVIARGSIEENGHVNRIREQEDGLNNIAFQNRDGTKTVYCYNYDVKYIDADGAIRDKSNKISQTSDGDYTNAENDINTIFPKNLNRDNGIELRFDEYAIKMIPDTDVDSAASLSNGSNKYGDQAEYVQYPSVFDKSVSLRYTPTFGL